MADTERFSFEELVTYKKGRELVKVVYQIQKDFPKEEMFALGDQIRRSSVSITSNLAEGSGRISMKEKLHFVPVAYGSLMETFSQLLTASDLGYVQEQDDESMRPMFMEVARILSGMRHSLIGRIEEPPRK